MRTFLIRAISPPKFITCHSLAPPKSIDLSRVYHHIQLPSANAQTVKDEPLGFIIANGIELSPRLSLVVNNICLDGKVLLRAELLLSVDCTLGAL